MQEVEKVLDVLIEHGFTPDEIVAWVESLDEGEVIQVDFKKRQILTAPPTHSPKKTQVNEHSPVETVARMILERKC